MNSNLNLLSLEKLSQLLKANEGQLIVSNQRKLIFTANISTIQQALEEIDIKATEDEDGYILDLSTIQPGYAILYYKWIDQDFDLSNANAALLIIDTNGNFALMNGGLLEQCTEGAGFKNEISNLLNYYQLRSILQSENLSDHHNEIKEEYVFYSSTKGVIKIKYETVAPRIKETDYATPIKSVIAVINEPHYKSYFINSLFKIAHEKPSVALIDIIKIADQLVGIIKRDYELVLKQFDFENFKDKLLKEKDKYFSSIREILNKVFSQLIGIPISISASAFATYKVEDEVITLILILVGFVFYVVIYLKIQSIYKRDIKELEYDFNRDFEIIKDKSGLPAEVITTERDKIKGKISQTRSMINILMVGIIVLGISFAIYLGNQIAVSLFSQQPFLRCVVRYIFSC